MDITHTCIHCFRGKKVFRISLDLYDAEGNLRRGVTRMKMFEFMCTYCWKKSFFDFYRFSHPDIILLLKRLDEQQTKLQKAIYQLEKTIDQLLVMIQSLIDRSVNFRIC